MTYSLQFNAARLTRKPPSGFDVETTLAHFAIITYCIEPERLRPHIPERFILDCIVDEDGRQKALLSVVPFLDQDFRFVRLPWFKWRFGQTNYRVYVTDRETDEHVVWFIGTSLASPFVHIPHYAWKLPWHKASIRFNTRYNHELNRYTQYQMNTKSDWAPAAIELEDSGQPPQELPGFPDLESGLVLLTHPLRGYYYRRDGQVGSYTIWHDRLQPTTGRVITAHIPLLEQFGLQNGDLAAIHSVLLQPEVAFTIYLPPLIVPPLIV